MDIVRKVNQINIRKDGWGLKKMGEVDVIDLKKRKLKEELESENPNKRKIKRLKESIERHKEIARYIQHRRIKNRRRQRGE